jgi:putative endonuclease
MHYVYILLSQKDHKFYIGLTNNLERRMSQHSNGEVVSTKVRRPLDLIFYEAYLNEKDAVRREDYFKTTKGKRTLKLMLKEFLSEQ